MNDASTMILVERLSQAALACGGMLVTAESCTGGGIAFLLTSLPGSSDWFERGFVTYSNAAKQELLGVTQQTLEKFGAVSKETAAEMADGALRNSHANIAVAVTGIAGPEGGSEAKPVGTVCFGWSRKGGDTLTTRVVFDGDRVQIREQAALMALQGLLDILEASS